MKRYVLIIVTVLLFLPAISSVSQVGAENSRTIGMVTGSGTGTYIRFGKEIAEMAKRVGLDIEVKPSEGSLNNIKRIFSRENAALGIVQSDVLAFIRDLPEMRRYADKIRLIFPFYNEEIHLFANRNIGRFEDLEGKRLVVGLQGSGNWLTSSNLLRHVGVKPEKKLYLRPSEAATAVLTGKADAMIYVAGKPVRLFSDMEQDKIDPELAPLIERVHFVPLNIQRMPAVYVSSVISSDDYAWFKKTIPTIAVKAVLVCYDFSRTSYPYYQMRCQQLSQLGQVIRNNIDELRKTGHSKWQEVNLEERVGIWPLDNCSRSSRPKETPEDLERRLIDYFERKK